LLILTIFQLNIRK